MFNGKISLWPIVKTTYAKRTSKNREAGTEEVQNVSVNKEVYREILIKKLLPAIRTKWPDRRRRIRIQQDGASAHIEPDDEEFCAAADIRGWDIKLVTQPARSPDTNICDLSFFASLQSEQ